MELDAQEEVFKAVSYDSTERPVEMTQTQTQTFAGDDRARIGMWKWRHAINTAAAAAVAFSKARLAGHRTRSRGNPTLRAEPGPVPVAVEHRGHRSVC